MLNAVSWNSQAKWPNDLEDQGPGPQLSIPVEKISRSIFGANSLILTQILYKLLRGQAKCPNVRIQNQMATITLNVTVIDPIFNTSREYPMMHVW